MSSTLTKRRILFESSTRTEGPTGQGLLVWSEIANLWGEVEYLERSGEQYRGDQYVAQNFVRVRIRYRTDISAKDRFSFDGVTYDIQNVEPVGKNLKLDVFGRGRAD